MWAAGIDPNAALAHRKALNRIKTGKANQDQKENINSRPVVYP
jgi:hypothetical protein